MMGGEGVVRIGHVMIVVSVAVDVDDWICDLADVTAGVSDEVTKMHGGRIPSQLRREPRIFGLQQ